MNWVVIFGNFASTRKIALLMALVLGFACEGANRNAFLCADASPKITTQFTVFIKTFKHLNI